MTKHNSRYRYKSKKYRRSNRKKYRKTGGAVSETELETELKSVFAHDVFVTDHVKALMALDPILLYYIKDKNSDKPKGETFKQIFNNIFKEKFNITNLNNIINKPLLLNIKGAQIDLLKQKKILNSIK